MLVNPSVPAKTVPEFIAYAKANPGKINMASAGNGTSQHVCRRAVQDRWPVSTWFMCPIAVRRPHSPICSAGRCRSIFATQGPSIEYIRAGKLRALAVTTATRSEALPDLPTVGDFVPGFEASLVVSARRDPRTRPAEIVDKLNKEINAALADPKIKARLADWAAPCSPVSPADFGKLIAEETEKWGKVVKSGCQTQAWIICWPTFHNVPLSESVHTD